MNNTFMEDVRILQPILPEEAESLVQAKEKLLLFIGQSTCPFCRKFSPKLRAVAEKTSLPIRFLNRGEFTIQRAVDDFMDKYGMETVPALLVSESGNLRTVCDSSLSEAEIEKFLQG